MLYLQMLELLAKVVQDAFSKRSQISLAGHQTHVASHLVDLLICLHTPAELFIDAAKSHCSRLNWLIYLCTTLHSAEQSTCPLLSALSMAGH